MPREAGQCSRVRAHGFWFSRLSKLWPYRAIPAIRKSFIQLQVIIDTPKRVFGMPYRFLAIPLVDDRSFQPRRAGHSTPQLSLPEINSHIQAKTSGASNHLTAPELCLYLAVVLDLFSRWLMRSMHSPRIESGAVHSKTMIALCNVFSTFVGTQSTRMKRTHTTASLPAACRE